MNTLVGSLKLFVSAMSLNMNNPGRLIKFVSKGHGPEHEHPWGNSSKNHKLSAGLAESVTAVVLYKLIFPRAHM